MNPADENDTPVFVGRFNIGAVSLHLPMIYAKARQEGKDFYQVLDYYLELIRQLHIRTYDYLGELKASTNPLAYCEGGFYGGNLGLYDKIKPLLKAATASFGITALNELQQLHNKKSLVEDGQFAVEVLEYINKKVAEFKEEDGHLYAIYGTPAENLCYTAMKKFKNKFGIIPNVSDRAYFTNSMHVPVWEEVDIFTKIDIESELTGYSSAGWAVGDLSNWDTSSASVMERMFNYCKSLRNIKIGDIVLCLMKSKQNFLIKDMAHISGFCRQ